MKETIFEATFGGKPDKWVGLTFADPDVIHKQWVCPIAIGTQKIIKEGKSKLRFNSPLDILKRFWNFFRGIFAYWDTVGGESEITSMSYLKPDKKTGLLKAVKPPKDYTNKKGKKVKFNKANCLEIITGV